MAAGPSGRVRRAAQLFDQLRSEIPDHRAFTTALKDRYHAEGLIEDDMEAYLMDQTRGLMQQVRKQRLKGEEARQTPLNFKEVLPDGNSVEFYKAIEDTTPTECAQFMHDQAKVIRREQTKFARLHLEFKGLHGQSYLQQLRLNLEEYLPPETDQLEDENED